MIKIFCRLFHRVDLISKNYIFDTVSKENVNLYECKKCKTVFMATSEKSGFRAYTDNVKGSWEKPPIIPEDNIVAVLNTEGNEGFVFNTNSQVAVEGFMQQIHLSNRAYNLCLVKDMPKNISVTLVTVKEDKVLEAVVGMTYSIKHVGGENVFV